MTAHRFFVPLLFIALFTPGTSVNGQTPSSEVQIAAAVSPPPQDLKAAARVLGYDAAGALVELRKGSNDLTCLTDDPSDNRFHAACYQNSLEPFMTRGRALRMEGKERNEIRDIRLKEIEAGALKY